MRLQGRNVIITGTARGIGRTVVAKFVAEGARVALFDIDQQGMEETIELSGHPDSCLPVQVDISSEAAVKEAVAKVLDAFQRIDVLHNNAAYNRDYKEALDTTEEDWDRELNVTLKGAFFCSKSVLPTMIKQKKGSIIMTGSWLAHQAYVKYCAYSVAKGGLLQLVRSLAMDYSPYGVRVNMISPGAVDTPAFAVIKDDPEFMAAVNKLTILGRIAQPEEIANVALFLATDDSSYITGAVIPVDGGAGAKLG